MSATERLYRELRRLLVQQANGLSLSNARVAELREMLDAAQRERNPGGMFNPVQR